MSDLGTWREHLASPPRCPIISIRRGCSSMVEQKLPKLTTRVRFPSPAPLALLMLLFSTAAGLCADGARFAVVDADAKTRPADDFPGKFLLVYFGYTHCADQGPTAFSSIVEALDEIGA